MRIRKAAAWVLGIVLASGAAPALADPMSMAYEIADAETGVTEHFDGGGYYSEEPWAWHSHGMRDEFGSPTEFAPGDHWRDWDSIPDRQINDSYWSVKNAGIEEYDVLDMDVNNVLVGGFNFGTASDRALGILAGDRAVFRLLKARFKNKTGETQTRLHVEFDAEPWAKYPAADDAGFKVLLSFGGGDENNFWLDELEVHWTEGDVDAWVADSSGNVDGNALAVHRSATFNLGADFGKTIPDDGEFEIHFSYTYMGQETGVGVDNLNVSFVPEPGTLALAALGLAGLALRRRK